MAHQLPVATDPWAGSEEDRRWLIGVMESFDREAFDPLEALIPALHEVQGRYRYIPEGAAQVISAHWQIPVTDIFGVVTFYSDFWTEPLGRNMLWVCEGAACYFMGGPELGEVAAHVLGVAYNETTQDGEWTLRRADFCYGACHLAPLVDVNHEIVGPLSADGLAEVIANPPAPHHDQQGGGHA